MTTRHHAISESARRTDFWPSVAEASNLVQRRVVADIGRAQPAHPAVCRFGSPDVSAGTAPGVRCDEIAAQ
jgi:hypothetical protein